MKLKNLLEIGTTKILLHLHKEDDSRYSEFLDRVVQSRSTLALALKELQEERLVKRRVMDTRPVQTRYTLTTLGKDIAQHLMTIQNLLCV